MMRIRPPSLRLAGHALVLGGVLCPFLVGHSASAQSFPAQPLPASGTEVPGTAVPGDGEEILPALDGPIAVRDLLRLPVRTYGAAPPVSEIDDILIKSDGTIDKLVLQDGTFLRMGLDGKRVAFPYGAAAIVPGPDGKPAYVRINIAKAYGQVVREFLYALISPTDFAVRSLLDTPVAALDMPSAGRIKGLWATPGGVIDRVDIDLIIGGRSVSWVVHAPFKALRLDRSGPEDPVRVTLTMTNAALRALPADSLPPPDSIAPPAQTTAPLTSPGPLAPPGGFGGGAPLAPLPQAGGQY